MKNTELTEFINSIVNEFTDFSPETQQIKQKTLFLEINEAISSSFITILSEKVKPFGILLVLINYPANSELNANHFFRKFADSIHHLLIKSDKRKLQKIISLLNTLSLSWEELKRLLDEYVELISINQNKNVILIFKWDTITETEDAKLFIRNIRNLSRVTEFCWIIQSSSPLFKAYIGDIPIDDKFSYLKLLLGKGNIKVKSKSTLTQTILSSASTDKNRNTVQTLKRVDRSPDFPTIRINIGQEHQLCILLVEDDENAYDSIMRWLKEENYVVRLATSYEEARSALETGHFHLAIIDIRLVEDDQNNTQGLQLLEDVERLQLRDVMPTIIIAAINNKELAADAWDLDLKPDRFILKEAGYLRKLINTVKELTREKLKINFELDYVSDSLNVLGDVAEDVNWSMAERPSPKLLAPQVRDLFGKLFADARSLYVSKLKPGLNGAAMVRIQPTWNNGLGQSYVTKVGRKDKVETEQHHYETNVKHFLTANAITQADVYYSRHLGALLYTFAEKQGVALKEFDEFYHRSETSQIIASLRAMFEETYRYWFANPERVMTNLPSLYYEAFKLDQKKLTGRIQIVLPELDPDDDLIQLTPGKEKVTNPIAWLKKHKQECVIQVNKCITHGDLTGRNIMVDDSGRCWLIDFYRTYKSHILRDFVIMETDVKYRLMSLLSLTDFLHFEEALLEADRQKQPPILPPSFTKDARKAAEVIFAIRQLAHRYAHTFNTQQNDARKEYLLSQLMGTLNVVRLRHISENRKLQAMHSAVMMCEELDILAGRQPEKRVVDMYREPVPVIQASFAEDSSFFAPALMLATAQQRFLAENLAKKNVTLFIGSAVPRNADWPNNQELALQLMKEVDISASTSDNPTKLFAFYINRMGNRKRLIQKYMEYYAPGKRPAIYRAAAKLPWQKVYTTNQHTYLEQAYHQKGELFTILLHANHESPENNAIPIYKLYGSINAKEEEAASNFLPITEYDYHQPQTIQRVTQLWQQIAMEVQQGTFLLMLCPSEGELMSAYQYCQPSSAIGLIWLAGGDISEEEQDVYRNLDYRVLPDTPGQLLKVLFTLTNYEGQEVSSLSQD